MISGMMNHLNTPHALTSRQLLRVAIVCFVLFAICLGLSVTDCAAQSKPKASSVFTITAVTFASLGAIDVSQSARCLSPGAGCKEIGPLYRGGGPARMVAVKAATVGGGIVWAWSLRKQHPKLSTGILIGLTAMQGVVVASNYRQLAKVRR